MEERCRTIFWFLNKVGDNGVLSKAWFSLVFLTLLISPAVFAESRAPLIQSVDIQVPVAPSPVTISGKKHLAYELHITNFRNFDVAVKRLEIFSADGKVRLAEFRDSELNARIGRPGHPDLKDKQVIGPGLRAVVFLWIAIDDAISIPSILHHRIEFDLIRSNGIENGAVEDRGVRINNDPPLVLDAPLKGGPWVALYDPKMEHGHRTSIYTIDGRARIPARFAIDWIRLNQDASRARGDHSAIANWHGYGAEVLAVADATVAEAKDDIPEPPVISGSSAKPVALENASGNYVTLDLGNGRYAFYEHLKHGSIQVKPGDKVKSGQVIGRLGNSGSSSSGPHLHFHVSDTNSTLGAEGTPYAFKNFEVIGAFETIGGFTTGELWKAAPNESAGARKLELPAANTVILFP